MKKKVTKKVATKKIVAKKVPVKKTVAKAKKIAKKPVAKTTNDPLNSKAAIADLRKQYTVLAKLNVQRAMVLESISKKEAALAEVLDLNMAKVEDRSNEDLVKKLSPTPPQGTVDNPTDLSIKTVSAPFCGCVSPSKSVLDGLNAVACKY